MRVIFNEVKKIFNIKMILVLLIMNILMYFMFVDFNIEYFPNGRPEGDIFKVITEMKKNYGPSMDDKEFKDFKKIYNEKVQEVNKYIKSNEEFRKCNIDTYDQFIEEDNKLGNTNINDKERKKFEKLSNEIIFEKHIDLFWELPVRQEMIKAYEEFKGDETSVFSSVIIQNYNRLIRGASIIILISVIFIVSPIYIKDKKSKINYLQYTCKYGREIFRKKIIAAIIASFIITTVQLICFFIIYSQNNTYMFLDCNINSIFSWPRFWYNATFKTYIFITIIASYILTLAFSLIAMLVSSKVDNYTSLMGFQIPIIICVFILNVNEYIEYIEYIGYTKFSKCFFQVYYLCIFLVPIILMILRWRKEKSLDIA